MKLDEYKITTRLKLIKDSTFLGSLVIHWHFLVHVLSLSFFTDLNSFDYSYDRWEVVFDHFQV